MMRSLQITTSLLVIALPTGLHADPAGDADEIFGFAGAHMGLNTPVGAIGLEAGLGVRWFRLSAGIGYGFRGLEEAVMVRAVTPGRTLVHETQYGIGVGGSRGPGLHSLYIGGPGDNGNPDDGVHFGDDTHWLNIELSAERSFGRSGFVRAYGGLTTAIVIDCAADTGPGMPIPCESRHREELEDSIRSPYFGIAVGFRFPAPLSVNGSLAPPPTYYRAYR